MKKIENNFDELILFDGAEFDPPIIDNNSLRVQTKNITLSPNHPFNSNGEEILLIKAVMVFAGVTKSIRTIHPYAGDPKTDGFLPAYEIVDIRSLNTFAISHVFEFDGILTAPLAHVDWKIVAEFFVLEISD